MHRILLLTVCFFLNACIMVGPNYKEPKKRAATHWVHKNKSVTESRVRNANWWKAFHDPTLNSLIQRGYHNNLSLQSAGVRVLQARAQLAQSVGGLFPQQQAMIGSLNYNRIGGSQLQTVLPTNFYTALLGFTATWEIDFWGKYRRAILANDATFLASFAAYDQALVSLTADIATSYIDIRTTQQLIVITYKNIRVQQIGLDIAKARYSAGQTSLLDVEQAQTELSQTQARIPTLNSELQRQKDALAVLLGTTPDQIDALLGKRKHIPVAPPRVAVGIPKESLANRPDIYQARVEAIAQLESIGAVKANLYPSFSLAGTFVFASNTIVPNKLSNIFDWANRSVTAGPTFNWPLLNYGQITNAVRKQDAVFQEALLKYLNLVLQAQQEIQDNITNFIETQHAKGFLTTATNAAIKSTQLAIIRYREGESDYTPVLDSERQQLQVQTQLTLSQGDIPKALVALYRALGGGWQIRGCNDIVPLSIKQQMAARTGWGNLLQQQNHEPAQNKAEQIKQRYLPNW